jgi:hypothetical protein
MAWALLTRGPDARVGSTALLPFALICVLIALPSSQTSSTAQCHRIRTIRLLQSLPQTLSPSFAADLKEYKKRTKKDIATHSLAAQVKSCNSPSAVLTVLQTQVQAFDPSPSANEKWTRLLDPTITVLYAFSGFVSSVAGPVNRETLSRLRPTL